MNTKNLERLTFRNSRFILEEVSTPKLRAKLARSPYWTVLDNDSYSTESLRAAKEYRRFSDARTEKIFQRTFQEHYAVPNMTMTFLPLDPHQVEGLRWILSRKRSYLAHAPGAGKTAQAVLGGTLAAGPGQILFIVPPTLVVNWEREILKFTEWLGIWPAIGIVGKSNRQERVAWRADFVICPDSMLTKSWVYPRLKDIKWKFIAVDEASRFKEPTAERSLAFYGGGNGERTWAGFFRDARHVVFLDGSPMPNRPMELWAPAFALHPESIDCMSYDEFGYRYCGARPNDRGQWEYLFSSNESELRDRLQKDFMHVVAEDALTNPERRRSMVVMSKDVRSGEHRAWERKNLGKIFADSAEFGWEIDEDASQGDLAKFRRELGLHKVPWIAQYVNERLEGTAEKILLFAWHRDVVFQLAEALKKWKPGIVIGGVNAKTREKEFEEFQTTDGQKRLLILNIVAGGRGHNLQEATRIIFGEWSWTDELNKQCEHRAARRGSRAKFIKCEYIVAPKSMDERVLSSVFTKERRVQKVIG